MGKAIPRICFLGYGLLEAWVFICFIVGGHLSDSDNLAGFFTGDSLLFSFSMLAVMAGCLIISALSARIRHMQNHPVVGGFAAIFVCVGSIAAVYLPFEIRLAAYLAMGILNAWLWTMWGEVFSRVETEEAEHIAIFSSIVEIVCVAIVLILPVQWAIIVSSALPPFAFIFFVLSQKDLDRREEAVKNEIHGPAFFENHFMMRLFVVIGLPSFCLFMFVAIGLIGGNADSFSYGSLLIGLIMFMAVLVLVLRFIPAFDLNSLYWIFTSFIVLVAFLYGIKGPSMIASAMVFGAWLAIDMLSWLFFVRMYREGFADVIRTFATGQSVVFSSQRLAV